MRANFYEDEDAYYDGEDDEPRELPEARLDTPGPCTTCGKPEQRYGCFSCGKPVCLNVSDYFAKTACGDWILDTWHPAHPDENEYYCNGCLQAYVEAIGA